MLLCDCQSFIKESYLLTYENDDDDDARRFNILTDQRAFESDRSPLSLTHDVKIKKRTKMRKNTRNKILRYCEEHSASVVLSWCTL